MVGVYLKAISLGLFFTQYSLTIDIGGVGDHGVGSLSIGISGIFGAL